LEDMRIQLLPAEEGRDHLPAEVDHGILKGLGQDGPVQDVDAHRGEAVLLLRALLELLLDCGAQGQARDHRRVLRLLDKLLDRQVVRDLHQAQALELRERDVGPHRDVLIDDLPEVHPVQLVAGEDQDQVVGVLAEMDDVSAHGVGRPLVPVQALLRLLRREDVDEPAAERVELVRVLDVAVERRRVELRQEEDPVAYGVGEIVDRSVTKPVLPRERHRGFAALESQRGKARPPAPPHDDCQHAFLGGHSNSLFYRGLPLRETKSPPPHTQPPPPMCGIVGYVGKRKASTILLEALKRLEYRGYDSAGIAIAQGGGLTVVKKAGRVERLVEETSKLRLGGTTGIGHTRWATHGAVTDANAHPHVSSDGKFALIHNGVIENYSQIKTFLLSKDYTFRSETDTEVLCNLIAYHYAKEKAERSGQGAFLESVRKALRHVQGTYGIAALCTDLPGEIVAARKASPLILGVGDAEYLLASDASALVSQTRNV